MSAEGGETAQSAAASLSSDAPWELFGQRLRRYEVYFDGRQIETVRGPIRVEGVGLRLFRPKEGQMSVGFQATTDLSGPGLRAMQTEAERLTRYATFPAARVGLPTADSPTPHDIAVVDPALWSDPVARVEGYVQALLSSFPAGGEPGPSFGSLKATLIENSFVNSERRSARYPETRVELEVAVKSSGGPEGRPPGEYWITREMRRLEPSRLSEDVATWCERARDVRRAKSPPSGRIPVGLPPGLLSEILPGALGARFSGAGRLRKIAVEPGSRVASESVSLTNDPTVPWALGSVPLDDEGSAPTTVPLIERGRVGELFYDCLHAAAFDRPSSGAASRLDAYGRKEWLRFDQRPTPAIATLVIPPGGGGPEPELLEQIDDGVWVDQLGWPRPDAVSSSFGGEIRIGYRVRHGRIVEPVRGGTVGGLTFAPPETPSLLGSVRAIGSVPRLIGQVYAPPIVVDGLMVSGEG